MINEVLYGLKIEGSTAAPGFMKPEGIIIYHKHSGTLFKKTIVGGTKLAVIKNQSLDLELKVRDFS